MDDLSSGRDQVLVFRKIDAILTVLAGASGELGLTEIAKRAELSKPTAHRLLMSLILHEYVEPGQRDGSYRLGVRLFELGFAFQHQSPLRRAARPAMIRLAQETEETIMVCIRRGHVALCIDRISGRTSHLQAIEIGGILPLHAGASSKVLLAAMDDDAIEQLLLSPLQEFTHLTQTYPQLVRNSVKQTRRQGYAISDGEFTNGLTAIGVPLRSCDGAVVAAMSLVGHSARVISPELSQLVDLVVAAGQAASQALGCPADGFTRPAELIAI